MLLGNLVVVVVAVSAYACGDLGLLESVGVAFVLSLLVSGLVRACAWVRAGRAPPLPPPTRSSCRCVFVFKSEACGYQGNAPHCDQRFESCRNPPRFGGFPGF